MEMTEAMEKIPEVELTGLGGNRDIRTRDIRVYEISSIEKWFGRVGQGRVKKIEVILGHDKFEVKYLKVGLKYLPKS